MRGEEVTGRNGEIMQQQGNMLSWRRLACREAAVGTEAYLMLFRSGAKHFPLQSSTFWFCSYAYESVDSKHNEWQMRAKKW